MNLTFLFFSLENNFYSWGWNEHYNLGTENDKNLYTPLIIQNPLLKEFMDKCNENDNDNYELKVIKIKIRINYSIIFSGNCRWSIFDFLLHR